MCGILGQIGGELNLPLFNEALTRLEHRGPDGEGIWSDQKEVTFGHRRLAIIDLTDGGKQPLEMGNYVLTFNGEIYNYLEIQKELIALGYQFKTESDSEVLLNSYIQWGSDCLTKFNGMWSLAIFDKHANEVFFSRDRFGKKPLFYYQSTSTFIFGSEMKAIAPFLKEVKPDENFSWMVANHFAYETTTKCLIEEIQRFPSAHYGIYNISNKSLKISKYWDILDSIHGVPETYEEQVDEFKDLFIDACKLRMRSDVPIGTALSGGLDSSAVLCTMAHVGATTHDLKVNKDWQHAFVASFPDSFLDETKYAQSVVNHVNINGTFLNIDPVEGIDKLGEYLYYFEEIDATSPVPMSLIYNAINKNGVRVSIDGHGVDEAFSGYGKSIFETFLDTINPTKISNVLNTYKYLHPQELNPKDTTNSLSLYVSYLYKRKHTLARNLIKKTPFLKSLIKDGPIDKIGNFNYNLYLLFSHSILPTLLRNYDRYSMMNSVEIRMPFMDHRIISYAFSIPWESKLKNGYTKSIIRDALKEFMPQDVVFRKQKIGFQTPILQYLKGPWNSFYGDLIHSGSFRNSELVDFKSSSKLFDKINSNEAATYQDGKDLWLQTIPHLWELNFLNKI